MIPKHLSAVVKRLAVGQGFKTLNLFNVVALLEKNDIQKHD